MLLYPLSTKSPGFGRKILEEKILADSRVNGCGNSGAKIVQDTCSGDGSSADNGLVNNLVEGSIGGAVSIADSGQGTKFVEVTVGGAGPISVEDRCSLQAKGPETFSSPGKVYKQYKFILEDLSAEELIYIDDIEKKARSAKFVDLGSVRETVCVSGDTAIKETDDHCLLPVAVNSEVLIPGEGIALHMDNVSLPGSEEEGTLPPTGLRTETVEPIPPGSSEVAQRTPEVLIPGEGIVLPRVIDSLPRSAEERTLPPSRLITETDEPIVKFPPGFSEVDQRTPKKVSGAGWGNLSIDKEASVIHSPASTDPLLAYRGLLVAHLPVYSDKNPPKAGVSPISPDPFRNVTVRRQRKKGGRGGRGKKPLSRQRVTLTFLYQSDFLSDQRFWK